MLPATLVAAYEQLRADTIAAALAQGYGAAVLLHQGFYAWALAWQKIAATSPGTVIPSERDVTATASRERAVVQLLAAMVLSVQKERCHASATL